MEKLDSISRSGRHQRRKRGEEEVERGEDLIRVWQGLSELDEMEERMGGRSKKSMMSVSKQNHAGDRKVAHYEDDRGRDEPYQTV